MKKSGGRRTRIREREAKGMERAELSKEGERPNVMKCWQAEGRIHMLNGLKSRTEIG